MSHFGIPGIGGSLGKCAVCGEPFVFEILTGQKIISFNMEQFKQTLYGHKKCMETMTKISKSGGDWHQLPEGPIKEGFAKIAEEQAKEAK